MALALTGLVAIGSTAVGGSAVPARLAFVNGVPGRAADVCVGAKEVRSALGYGRWAQTVVAPGTRTITFRVAARGRCKGAILAQSLQVLGAGDTLTLVATAKSPQKMVVFDNAGLGVYTPPSVGFTTAWRNASDSSDLSR